MMGAFVEVGELWREGLLFLHMLPGKQTDSCRPGEQGTQSCANGTLLGEGPLG